MAGQSADTFTAYDGSEFGVLERPTNPQDRRVMRFRFVHDPHHGFEAYVRALTGLTHELRTTSPRGPRAAVRMARLWADHPDLIRPADLPLKIALKALAPVAGRKARDPTP